MAGGFAFDSEWKSVNSESIVNCFGAAWRLRMGLGSLFAHSVWANGKEILYLLVSLSSYFPPIPISCIFLKQVSNIATATFCGKHYVPPFTLWMSRDHRHHPPQDFISPPRPI